MRAPLKTALMVLSCSTAVFAQTESEEVIVACSSRAVSYEPASKALADSLRDVVIETCAHADVPGWLCTGRPLSFVRSVYANASEDDQDGYVCLDEDIDFRSSDLVQRIRGSQCLLVSYDEEANLHYIDPERLRELAAAAAE